MPKILCLVMALLMTACGTSIPTIKPYKLEIQQGNVVTSKMLLQLKPGMTKSQVRYIMGTPLIHDSFHGNRWDYFYQMRESGKVTEQRRIYLTFDNELLDKVHGDVVPQGSSEAQAAAPDSEVNKGPRTVQPEVQKKEKGFFNRLIFWGDDEDELDVVVPKPSEKPIDQAVDAIEPKAKIETAEPKVIDEVEKEKGIIDKLKFWGDDDDDAVEAVEPKPVEKPIEQAVEVVEPKAKVEVVEPEVVDEGVKKKGILDRLKFWGDDDDVEAPVVPKQEEAGKVETLSGVEIKEIPGGEEPEGQE